MEGSGYNSSKDTARRVRIIDYVSRFYSPLRPLRSLREVCLRAVMSFLHADYAESAEFFIFFSVLRWRWRGRKLRYDERAQRGEM